jgi:hypothetical protein
MAVGQWIVAAIGNVYSCQYGNRLEETGVQRVRRWFRLAQGGEHSVQLLVAYRRDHALLAPGADRRVELRRRFRAPDQMRQTRGRWEDVRPNWKEKAGMPDSSERRPAREK